MTQRRARRLTREDWLKTGLETLGSEGPTALGAERLARRLGTTKGSFYWHFDDLPCFHAALIAAWEGQAVRPGPEAEPTSRDAVPQLRDLAQAMAARDGTEAAMRAWALSEPLAAAAVARTDTARAGQLAGLLDAIGIGNPQMTRLVQAAAAGMALAPGSAAEADDTEAMGSLIDLILALR